MSRKLYYFGLVLGLNVVSAILLFQSGITWLPVLLMSTPLAVASLVYTKQWAVIVIARLILPVSFGLFAVCLFSFSGSGTAIPDFYRITNFGFASAGNAPTISFEVDANFFNAINVLYAIMVAFLLWKGLTDFDELEQYLNEEAEQIWAIVFLTEYFRDEGTAKENLINIDATNAMRKEFRMYVNNAIGDSDGETVHTEGIKILKENDDLIDKCVEHTKRLTIKNGDENDRIALQEIMRGLSSLVAIRSKRRVCMASKMSPYILGMVLVISMTMLVPFLGRGQVELGVNHLYIFMLSTTYLYIYMTLLDLNAPFEGYWSIQLSAFNELRSKIDGMDRRYEQGGAALIAP